MAMVLALPASLEDELTRRAIREDLTLSPADRATLLLYLATILLKEDRDDSSKNAVKTFLSSRSIDAEGVASAFEDMLTIWAGRRGGPGGERPIESDAELIIGELPPVESLVQRSGRPPRRPSARGKYAHLGGSSEDFIREKHEEIEREERRMGWR